MTCTGKSNQSSVYKLGRIAFRVEGCNQSFRDELDTLLPQSQDEAQETLESPSTLRNLQNQIYEMHDDCLWLDAGCLLTPAGKKILIIGRSGAGKSTTTMALALAHDWKVLAEDILLIDYKNDLLITFGAPFSLKPGTVELLRDSVGRVPDPIVNGEWSPLGTMVAPRDLSAHFDVSVVFTRDRENPCFKISTLSPAEFIRKCLPVSNVLRMKGAGEKLLEYVSKGSCIEIADGTVQERVDKILELAK
jgi:hypothetical protein